MGVERAIMRGLSWVVRIFEKYGGRKMARTMEHRIDVAVMTLERLKKE